MKRDGLVSTGVILALIMPLAACGGGGAGVATVDREAVADTIRTSERQMLADFRSRDANKVAAHYADDAVVMITNRPSMIGREAITQGMAQSIADPAFALDFANQKTEVAASGDLAYSRGTYTVSYTHPESKSSVTEKGNYVNIYKLQADGSWKIVEDLTSPMTAAAPSAAVPA
jgi:uncharacterized protein (TIGR02246 family)